MRRISLTQWMLECSLQSALFDYRKSRGLQYPSLEELDKFLASARGQ